MGTDCSSSSAWPEKNPCDGCRHETVEYVGIQLGLNGEEYILYNCTKCGSTISGGEVKKGKISAKTVNPNSIDGMRKNRPTG